MKALEGVISAPRAIVARQSMYVCLLGASYFISASYFVCMRAEVVMSWVYKRVILCMSLECLHTPLDALINAFKRVRRPITPFYALRALSRRA